MAKQPVKYDVGQPAGIAEEAARMERFGRESAPYDAKKAAPLYNNPLPIPLPPNSVVALVNSSCWYCQTFLAATGYPLKTPDGRTIIYADMNSASETTGKRGIAYAKQLGLSEYGTGFFEAAFATQDLKLHGKDVLMQDGKPVPKQIFPVLLNVDESGKITHAISAGLVQSERFMNMESPPKELSRDEKISKRFFEKYPADQKKQDALFHAPIPAMDKNGDMDKIGDNDRVIIVNSFCGHCQIFAARTGYAAKDEAGHRLIYVDLSTKEGQEFQQKHFPDVKGTPTLYTRDVAKKWQPYQGPDLLAELFPKEAQKQEKLIEGIIKQVDAEEAATKVKPVTSVKPTTGTPAAATTAQKKPAPNAQAAQH